MKKCNKCKVEKDEIEFHKNKNKKDDLDINCKSCEKVRKKEYNNRPKIKKHLKELRRKNREKELIKDYKKKDKKKNRICDLTVDWMKENITNKPCIYCNEMKENIGCDRIDNDKGHLMNNVVPCCYICNTTRNVNFSFDEMKEIGETIKKIKQRRKNETNN